MRKIASLMLAIAVVFPVPAAASDKDAQIYDAMISCFAERANSFDDLTTPLGDMADVIVGMCWEKVSEHSHRWVSSGSDWAAFYGPVFILKVTTKAKEAVYSHRMTKRQRSGV